MDDNLATARTIATSALNDLMTPGVSLEIPIRKALRVATLRRHAFWRVWFQLQLIDLTNAKGDLRQIKETLKERFPEEIVYQQVAQEVFKDYMNSRSGPNLTGQMFGGPIANLELIANEAVTFLSVPEGSIAPGWVAIAKDSRLMINAIKNRVQDYLMKIESSQDEQT